MDKEFILKTYKSTQSLRETSKICHMSIQTARRILASEHIYASDLTRIINHWYNSGTPVDDIAEELKISPKAVRCHLPYTKGSYCVGEKSQNAIRISKCRTNKKYKTSENT